MRIGLKVTASIVAARARITTAAKTMTSARFFTFVYYYPYEPMLYAFLTLKNLVRSVKLDRCVLCHILRISPVAQIVECHAKRHFLT